ncbi:MAG: MBL fold metallo-hydrolase [Rikenellaceae bacterium]|nr:MBL fold metallo-hydrolase [Rikenellaceae bacterium]
MAKFVTPLGKIDVTIIGHASVLIEWNGRKIMTDPYSEIADYTRQPVADLILITHDHYDHLDTNALKPVTGKDTIIISTPTVARLIPNVKPLRQGESYTYKELHITATYAYNIEHRNENGTPFHPKGVGNGYLLDFGGFRLYFAGDTELIPEMRELGPIDVAFLPKNLPFTMSDDMFIEAVDIIKPCNVCPYHFFQLDVEGLERRMPEGVKMFIK